MIIGQLTAEPILMMIDDLHTLVLGAALGSLLLESLVGLGGRVAAIGGATLGGGATAIVGGTTLGTALGGIVGGATEGRATTEGGTTLVATVRLLGATRGATIRRGTTLGGTTTVGRATLGTALGATTVRRTTLGATTIRGTTLVAAAIAVTLRLLLVVLHLVADRLWNWLSSDLDISWVLDLAGLWVLLGQTRLVGVDHGFG